MRRSDPVPSALQPSRPATTAISCVDLYWLPLGAGGHSVRLNGIAYEALRRAADGSAPRPLPLGAHRLGRRPPWAIEMAPIPDRSGAARGVVAEGRSGAGCSGGCGSSATRCVAGPAADPGRRRGGGLARATNRRRSDSSACSSSSECRHLGAETRAVPRHVELELARIVAAPPQRSRLRRGLAADRGARAWLGRGCRRGAATVSGRAA